MFIRVLSQNHKFIKEACLKELESQVKMVNKLLSSFCRIIDLQQFQVKMVNKFLDHLEFCWCFNKPYAWNQTVYALDMRLSIRQTVRIKVRSGRTLRFLGLQNKHNECLYTCEVFLYLHQYLCHRFINQSADILESIFIQAVEFIVYPVIDHILNCFDLIILREL